MQPQLRLLTPDLVDQIIDEAYQLLLNPGIMVKHDEARSLLAEAGARLDNGSEVVKIPREVAQKAIKTVPSEFYLYDQEGNKTVHYGGDSVHFDPGSSGVNILDADTLEHRPAITSDLIKVIQTAELLDQYAAQSTSLVCSEIPKEVGDLYRLYLVLLYSKKPIITGAFSASNTGVMIEMLALFAGGKEALRNQPRAVFDVCPTPPLIWSPFGSQSLIDLARAGIPAEIVSMPLAGVAAPVTLLGSVIQHAAECISGMTIHQLAEPGSPIVWGGAPAIMDMRQGTTPMGAVETAMIDASYTQVGKYLGFPTHTYLGATDSKVVDYQAGMESSTSAMIGALAGINMISGAGMLDFLACMSPEKLLIDAEAISMALRMLKGVQAQTDPLAADMYDGINFKGNFLSQRLTRKLVRKEQYLPSPIIDRGSNRTWQDEGRLDTFDRAKLQLKELLKSYQPPDLPAEQVAEIKGMVTRLASDAGLDKLPVLNF